jgi:hypothetical protein
MEKYEDLAEEQRAAHLVFWYDAEAFNGGHIQYFQNRGVVHLSETIVALGNLGAACQQLILRDAAERFSSCERAPIQSLDDFHSAAVRDEFSDLDSRLYAVRHLCSNIFRLI